MQTCSRRFSLKPICLCRYFPTFFSFPLGCWLRASNLSTKSASNCTLFDVASFHFSSQLTIYLFYFLHLSLFSYYHYVYLLRQEHSSLPNIDIQQRIATLSFCGFSGKVRNCPHCFAGCLLSFTNFI